MIHLFLEVSKPDPGIGKLFRVARGKILGTNVLVWIYCNPLKSHKTAKAFFGNVWRKQAEIWKCLEKAWRRRDRAGRTRRLQAMTAPIDSIISPCRLTKCIPA